MHKMVNVSEQVRLRGLAHALSAVTRHDWRTCLRWLERRPVRPVCADDFARAARDLGINTTEHGEQHPAKPSPCSE
jgi:hypothetical protein